MKVTCLIAALLSILFSGLLLADHKSSHAPGEKVPKTWVLLDDNGDSVGDIVTIDSEKVLVEFTIAERPVFLWVTFEHILWNAIRFFETDDCTGAEFGRSVSEIFGNPFDLWHLRDDFGILSAVRIIDTTEFDPFDVSAVPYLRSGINTTKSVYRRGSDGECFFHGSMQGVYPIMQLADDLYEQYPRPYTLVEK